MTDDDAPSPAEVRVLRGKLSRTRFAELLGVTAHTVFRWELDIAAPHARRPRGAELLALRELARRSSPPGPPPQPALLTAASDAVLHCRWSEAERKLAELARGGKRDAATTATAFATTALVQLWGHVDPRAAHATLVLALAVDKSLAVDIAAAHVFSAPDGLVFDPGRAMHHVRAIDEAAAVEPAPDAVLAARIAELRVAFHLLDPALMACAVGHATDMPAVAPPVYRLLLAELRAHQAVFEGRPALAWQRYEACARDANRVEWPVLEARAIACSAALRLYAFDDDPRDVLDSVRASGRVAARAHVRPGYHTLIATHVQADVLIRQLQLGEAATVLARACDLAGDLAWPIHQLVLPLVRLHVYTGSLDAFDALIEMLGATAPAWARRIRPYTSFATAARAELRGELGTAATGYAEAAALAEGLPDVIREAALGTVRTRLAARDAAGADRALDAAERVADRFPSTAFGASVRRLRGVALLATERATEARVVLEAAAAVFEAIGDRPETLLARYAVALAARAAGAPDLAPLLAHVRAELSRLGLAIPAYLRAVEDIAVHAAPAPTAHAELAQALERIALCGAAPVVIRRELVHALGALVARPVRVAAAGGTQLLAISDGDRMLRIAVDGEVDAGLRALVRAVGSVAELALAAAAHHGFSDPADPAPAAANVIAVAPGMRRLRDDALRVASSRAPVLIDGESGSGKEVIAKLIHDQSARVSRPFVAVDCGAVPDDMFAGHMLIGSAAGGTLFLDDVGALPPVMQPGLLELFDGELDVRVIAATSRDLASLVAAGQFREELLYRLALVALHVPPLRDRPEDVVALARYFVVRFTPPGREPPVLAPDALELLLGHHWPRNVRELRTVIERALAAGAPAVLGRDQLRLAD